MIYISHHCYFVSWWRPSAFWRPSIQCVMWQPLQCRSDIVLFGGCTHPNTPSTPSYAWLWTFEYENSTWIDSFVEYRTELDAADEAGSYYHTSIAAPEAHTRRQGISMKATHYVSRRLCSIIVSIPTDDTKTIHYYHIACGVPCINVGNNNIITRKSMSSTYPCVRTWTYTKTTLSQKCIIIPWNESIYNTAVGNITCDVCSCVRRVMPFNLMYRLYMRCFHMEEILICVWISMFHTNPSLCNVEMLTHCVV